MKSVGFLALAVLLVAGCNGCPRGEHVPLLSEAQVAEIANNAASAAGYDLAQWQLPELHFEFVSRDCTWSVFYESKSNMMPGHFLVLVKDKGGAVDIHGGI